VPHIACHEWQRHAWHHRQDKLSSSPPP
jgi:hypothetical protein